MIIFKNISKTEPFDLFRSYYDDAKSNHQTHIHCAAISSYNKKNDEVNSRFVNIKYIEKDMFIFFSNYLSIKAEEFKTNNNISILFFWSKIDLQIRIKAKIQKISEIESDKHFNLRSQEKNILAIVSNQSQEISSYSEFIDIYKEFSRNNDLNKLKRPKYWGGYACKPFEFEFWIGHENRLNKRTKFKLKNTVWEKKCLQP